MTMMNIKESVKTGMDSVSKPCAIGIDIGGTYIKYSLLNEDGEVLFHSKSPTPSDKQELLIELGLLICSTKSFVERKKLNLVGVGIGVPSQVENGVVIGAADNLPYLLGMNFQESLSEMLDLPITVKNDCHMMAVAEEIYGAAKDVEDVVFLTVGTGIGGALKFKGELYAGNKGLGCEVGHMIIQEGGYPCGCGRQGCFEVYASVTSLIQYYHSLSGCTAEKSDGSAITQGYLRKDINATAALTWHFNNLAVGITNIVNLLAPQKVVIGGGITEAGDFYLEEIKRRVHGAAKSAAVKNVEICTAQSGSRAGSIGAGALVMWC
jgi:glucokinase